MFEHILVPMPSEFFPARALRRAKILAKKFGSKVTVLYIIEDQVFSRFEKTSAYATTAWDMERIEHEVIEEHEKRTAEVALEIVEQLFESEAAPCSLAIRKGVYSQAILNEVQVSGIDLVVLEFERASLLKYRIFEQSPVPVWIESGEPKHILVVCSNVAPNEKVPRYAAALAKALNTTLHMVYVVDAPKSASAPLVRKGYEFIESYQTKHRDIPVTVEVEQGALEAVVVNKAKAMYAGLVILGREDSRSRRFSLPRKSIKKEIAKRAPNSMLLVK